MRRKMRLKNPILKCKRYRLSSAGLKLGDCRANARNDKVEWSEQAKLLCGKICCFRESNQFIKYAELIYDMGFSESYRSKNKRNQMVSELAEVIKYSQSKKDQRRQVEALKKFDSSGWINQLALPVLVISPDSDLFATPEEGKQLADAVINGKQIIINDSGHAVLAEKPEELIAIFIQELVH